MDPDFHRRDLWEAIEMGDYPEYEFGVQLISEEDQYTFPFDILDATKLWPEELVPVRRIGKMTLNRNPDNYFAETEQVAFHTANVVPGIDFLRQTGIPGLSVSEAQVDGGVASSNGIVIASNTSNLDAFSKEFISALTKGRHWVHPNHEQVPA